MFSTDDWRIHYNMFKHLSKSGNKMHQIPDQLLQSLVTGSMLTEAIQTLMVLGYGIAQAP